LRPGKQATDQASREGDRPSVWFGVAYAPIVRKADDSRDAPRIASFFTRPWSSCKVGKENSNAKGAFGVRWATLTA